MRHIFDDETENERKIHRKIELLSNLIESGQATEEHTTNYTAARIELAQLYYDQGNYRNALNALEGIDEPALKRMIMEKLEE